MINKELKKLNRRELVDIIYQLKKNEEEMQEKIAALEAELQDKRINISEAGSIADAATNITNIFSNAQTTADMYLNEISCMKEETARACEKMIAEAEEKVESIMAEGKRKYSVLAAKYKSDYKKWQHLRENIQKSEEKKNED